MRRDYPTRHTSNRVPRSSSYLCCQAGGRFSTNAAVPSTRSALPNTTPNASCSKRSPASSFIVNAALRAAFTMNEDAGLRFEQEAFGVVFGSADRVEGTAAFVEKRPPAWQHK